MADKTPIRGAYNGSSLTGLAEYATGDTVGIAFGGTGLATVGSNQLLTGNGTSALTSESNLTYDGTTLATTAFTATGNVSLDGGTFVFNESGADKDFRVEGDSEANLLMIDASTDRIGIGTATPSHLLDVEGVAHIATCVVTPKICISSQYVLPAADGSAGEILCTDGSGTIAFAEAASSGHTIANEGSVLASRTCLNFTGAGVTASDNSGTNATDVLVCATNALLGIRAADGTACTITLSNAAVGTCLQSDTAPKLGGNLDVNSNSIISASNGNIPITPNGSGIAIIDGICHPTADGSAGQVLCTNGSAALQWATIASTSPGGSSGQVQFNSSGSFGGSANLTWDNSNNRLGIGTATPGYLLDTVACNATYAAKIQNVTGGDGLYIKAGGSSSEFALAVNNFDDSVGILSVKADGNIGIGTAAPDVQVHVEAGTDTTTGTLPSARFERTGASQTGVVLRSNNIDGLILRADSAGLGAVSSYEDLAFYTGATPGSSYGTAHLRIETSGNIGIGGAAANPDGLVHIMCASAGTETASTYGDLLVLEDDTDNGMTILTPDASYGQIIFQSPSASGAGISTANARFAAGYNGGAPRLDISVGATSNMMTWTSTGRIGIGTSVVSTGALLQLYSAGTEIDIQATAAAEAGRIRFRNTQGDWRVGVGAINGTGNFEALLTDGGGIGGFFINANGHMDLSNKSAGAYYGFHMDAKCTAQDNNTSWFVKLDDCVATRGYWYSDGDVWTADAGTLTSDQRLKTNIVDASPKLEDVMKLKVRNFEWIPEYHPAKVGEKKIGFIAQELETVFPSLISEHDVARNNEIQEVLYKEGDVIPSGKSVGDVKVAAKAHEPVMRKSYKSAFTPILVKALQELTLRVEALESSVT